MVDVRAHFSMGGLGIDPLRRLPFPGGVDEDVRVRGVTASRIPHTSSVRPSRRVASRGAAGWVTIPCSAIQFSGSAVPREAVGPRRWGWVCSQPRGEGQAEVRSASERVRTTLGSGGGRRSRRLGDFGALVVAEGPPNGPAFADSLSPTSAPLRGGPCPSRGVDATDPWPGSKRFCFESSKTSWRREFGVPEGIWRGGEERGAGLRRGRPAGIGSAAAEISPRTERRSRAMRACSDGFEEGIHRAQRAPGERVSCDR